MMKVKIWIKAISALGILIVALVVACVAILKSINFNDYKSDIKNMVVEATGRKVTLGGDINFVFSLNPSLQISNVTLGNADWGVKEPMMVLKSLNAKVDLMSLLTGQVDVDYFVVDGLKLVFQTNGKGLANWEFSAKKAVQPPPSKASTKGTLSIIPRVRDVRLNNVDLTYLDGATGGKFHVVLAKIKVQADTFDSPMHVVIAAAFQGVNFAVKADLGSMHHFVGSEEGGAFPVDLTATAPGLSLNVKGGVEQPHQGMKVQAVVSASASNMDFVSKLFGMDLASIGQVEAHLNVLGAGTSYEFSKINITSMKSDLAGDVTIDLSANRPRVSGRLISNNLNLDRLIGHKPTNTPVKIEGPLFTKDKLPWSSLKNVDVDVTVKGKAITVADMKVFGVDTRVQLDGGVLNLKPLKLELLNGALDGQVKINTAVKIPTLSTHVKIQGVDAGKLITFLGYGDLVHLNLDGQLKLSAHGFSTRALASSLNGSVKLFGKNGTINDQMIKSVGNGLGNMLPWASQENANIISCFVAHLPFKNGNAVAQTVQMQTPGFDVRVTGNIDLPGELFHLTVDPRAKTTSLASFAVPMRIKGHFAAPYISVDPKDAVLGTVGNIVKAPVGVLIDIFGIGGGEATSVKAGDPCLQAPRSVKKSSRFKSIARPTRPPQNNANAVTHPLKDLGSALQGIFGQ